MPFYRILVLMLLVSCGGSVTVETAAEDPCAGFVVLEVSVDTPMFSDGTVMEGARDIYASFSGPARKVRLQVTEAASGHTIEDAFYGEQLYTTGQTTFALTVASLKPLTAYTFTVSGTEPDSMCDASRTDGFQTSDF